MVTLIHMSDPNSNTVRIGIEHAQACVGSYSGIGRLCAVTRVSIRRRDRAGHLPRTDYTGETYYGQQIAEAVGDPGLLGPLHPPLGRTGQNDE
jgi:hypothetical protein